MSKVGSNPEAVNNTLMKQRTTQPILCAALFAAFALPCLVAPAPAAAGQKDKKGGKSAPAGKPALTSAQVAEKLEGVPVFTVIDEKGAPLTASGPEGGKPIVGVFIEHKDAEEFLGGVKKRDGKLAAKLQVAPVPLGQIYTTIEANRNVQFAFVPNTVEVKAAQVVWNGKENSDKPFAGTPLFIARSGKNGGYMTMSKNNRTVIPVFFEKQPLDELIAGLLKVQPDMAKTLLVEAVSLENMLNLLRTEESQQVGMLEFIPPKASVTYLRQKAAGAQPKAAEPAGPGKKP